MPHENRPYDLIIIHRTDRGFKHRGEISFPGGKVDPDDKSRIDTALRECEEEIGVSRKEVTLLGCLDDFPTMTKYVITPVVGYINEDQELVKDDREVQEILKVPIDFFFSKNNFRERAIDIGVKKFPIFYFNYKNNKKTYTIWGATAFMIANFIKLVYDVNLSKLNISRFTMEEIKPLKNFIEMRKKILSKNK
jgi:8-oxo-dGTP pyrophosphatase MutT (NUDIX family)